MVSTLQFPSPPTGLPPLPAEWKPVVFATLLDFFAFVESQTDATAFYSSSSQVRAELVASRLCGGGDSEFQTSTVSDKLSPCPTVGVSGGSAAEPLTGGKTSDVAGAAANGTRSLRVLVTGCFDLMHAGHYNALRQAKMAFPRDTDVTLVAGVHGDAAIEAAKGAPTVCTNDERVEMVRACRWVDEVVGDLPYEVPVSLLDRLRCDLAIHGDDLPRVSDGTGLFDEVRAAGRLHIVKRTEGTSTTMLIGRLLSMSREHLQKSDDDPLAAPRLVSAGNDDTSQTQIGVPDGSPRAPADASAPLWMLLPTMSRMAVFFADRTRRLGDAKIVVYAPGEWDMFHVGHVQFLQQARALGDFLLVGCYSDETIHRKKGRNYPLQTLHERALNVLACKHVDDVLLSAPWQVTKDLLTTLNVSVVVTGKINVYADPLPVGQKDPLGLGDPFVHARAEGMLRVLESACKLTMDVLAERIVEHAEVYAIRQLKKQQVERDYNEAKIFVAES